MGEASVEAGRRLLHASAPILRGGLRVRRRSEDLRAVRTRWDQDRHGCVVILAPRGLALGVKQATWNLVGRNGLCVSLQRYFHSHAARSAKEQL
jgi:hypothetical protein